MTTMMTNDGHEVTVLPNVLNLRINSLCRNRHGLFLLVHNATKRVQLLFEPGLDDGTIQGCVLSIERYGEVLPETITISSYIPPITNLDGE
jgi:hypothetical protein